MNFLATLKVALDALRVNKLRSILTMLGIIIGVGAVITMVAVGAGAQARVEDQIRSLGSNLIIILSGNFTSGGVRLGSGSQLTISEDDAYALAREIPASRPRRRRCAAAAQVVFGNSNWATQIFGITPEYLEARQWEVASGRAIDQPQVDSAAKVVLLGQTVARHAVRRRRSGRRDGAHPPRPAHGDRRARPQGPEHDRAGPGRRRADPDHDGAQARARRHERQDPQRAEHHGARARRRRHGRDRAGDARPPAPAPQAAASSQEDDFFIRNLSEVLAAQEASSKILALLLAAIASVSLVVGGIGIMNIMLVSVTERTREIGLRMAVGARGRDILTQFLVEAVTLALIGGLVGIALGAIASFAVGHFAGWRTEMSAASVLLAVGFSGAIGVFFGFYPARTASRLVPIDALRHE